MPTKSRGSRATRGPAKPVQQFRVAFRGVRGSHNAAEAQCLGYGGHTICMEMRVGGHLLIFDAGTGLIGLGQELMAERNGRRNPPPIVASIFLSHTHHDHVHGLPFFEPAHSRCAQINVYGLRPVSNDLAEVLDHTMRHAYFPAQVAGLCALNEIHMLDDRDVVVFDAPGTLPTVHRRLGFDAAAHRERVVLYPQKNTAHPKGGTLFYRVDYLDRSVVFATDTEGYVGGDTRLIRFADQATLLVHDTQYTYEEYRELRQGWGHSTVEMATAVARQAHVQHLCMFHYDPSYCDSVVEGLERVAQGIFPNTFAPREGDTVDILSL